MGVIKRQGTKNTLTSFLGIAIGFVNLMIIQPQFLTKEELGLTRILYSFSILVAMFVPMGIGNATIRFFPLFKNTEKKHYGYFGFMVLFPLLGYLLAAVLIWTFKDFVAGQWRRESPLFTEYFNFVFPLIFFNAFIAVLTSYCSINYKTTIPAFLNDVVVRILTIALVSVYFLKWLTFYQFTACFVGIYGLQLAILMGYILQFDKISFRFDWAEFRERKIFELIRYGLLLWFASVASIGIKYFDSIMLGKFMPLEFVAVYAIAAFIPTVIEAPLTAFEKIAASKIAFAWADNDHDQIKQIYHKSSLYLFIVGGFLFLMVNTNTHTLLGLLPSGYQAGEIVVFIISLQTIFNMATGLNAPILFNSERYRYGAVFLISLAVLILFLQYFLIPVWGMTGAAIATASASVIYNLMLFFAVWKYYGLQPFDDSNLKVLFSIAVCYAIQWMMPHYENFILDFIVRSCVVGIPYLLLIKYFQVGNELFEQVPMIRDFFRRKR